MQQESASLQTIALPLPIQLSDEDQARADFYALIARLMLAPPNAALLAALAAAEPLHAGGLGEEGIRLEDAWLKLTQAASVMDAGGVAEEFAALFVSTGNPLINPNGSFYLAGHLNDVPLAELRQDLSRLRIARARGVGEFEDHLGALCETMRVLIAGAPGIARHLGALAGGRRADQRVPADHVPLQGVHGRWIAGVGRLNQFRQPILPPE